MNKNIEKIKNILNNKIQRRNSFPKEVIEFCKSNNILIVYGESDDLLEFRGIIYDEIGAYNGISYLDIDKDHQFYDLLKKLKLKLTWEDHKDISWKISVDTKLDYDYFNMMDDDDIFSIGLIIQLD